MAIDFHSSSTSRPRSSGKASLEYRLIFVVSFAFFLLAALIERLLPWTWMKGTGASGRRTSVLGKAWDAAEICTTYAFMG